MVNMASAKAILDLETNRRHSQRPGRPGSSARRLNPRIAKGLTLAEVETGTGSVAVVPSVTPVPLDEAAKARIFRLHRQSVPLEVLAGQFGVTPARVGRIINETRARRLRDTKIEFIPNPSFDDPSAEAEILASQPIPAGNKGTWPDQAPEGLPPYLVSLYDVPLLTREQEMHLFRKMNYLKYRAWHLRERIDPTRAKTADLDAAEAFLEEALAVKNQIIRANLRLVVSIAKRYLGPSNNFFELISDGNMSLIRAVEKFDYARGNKFSTYATWAVVRNFSRSIPEEKSRRDRFVTGHEEMFESAPDHRPDEHEIENAHARMQKVVRTLLSRLDDRERTIITSRFGLGGASAQTLEQLGHDLGITKERVRQLEARAQDKLRRFADQEKLDISLL
jgi:RNA polymerase primary sigma factor